MHDPLAEIRARIKDELRQHLARLGKARPDLGSDELTAFQIQLAELGEAIANELMACDATVESLRGFDWWTLLPSGR